MRSMSTTKRTPPPKGLGAAGQALWRQLVGTYSFGTHELAGLVRLCRQQDDVARLEALIEDQGALVVGAAGQQKLNPAGRSPKLKVAVHLATGEWVVSRKRLDFANLVSLNAKQRAEGTG